MKKILSLSLMAIAMLISGNAKADVKEVNNWSDLKQAFVDANSTPELTQIKLTGSILNQEECLTVNGGNVELDLNGFNITLPNQFGKDLNPCMNFMVTHGNLNIIGSGVITNATESHNVSSFLPTYRVSPADKVTIQCASVRGATTDQGANYSVLSIGKDVTMTVTPSDPSAFPIENQTITGTKAASGTGTIEKNLGGKVAVDVYFASSTDTKASFGAVLNIAGTVYGNKYGAQVSGNLKYTTGNIPVVNIEKTAKCSGSPYDTQGVGVYIAGYAKVNMAGEADGATGMFVKAGEVTLEDAVITSTWQGEYQQPEEGKRSGVEAGGSGLVVESAKSYAGQMEVDIKGETKITGTSGYAVDERVDTDAEGSKVEALVIESGSFATVGNDAVDEGQGTIIVSQDTKAQTDVNGGKWQDEAAVTQGLVDPSKGGFVMETEDEQGNPVYIISNTGSDSPVAWISDDMSASTGDKFFKYTEGMNKVVASGTVKAKYIWMAGNSTLTIKSGATVIAEQVLTEYISGDPDIYSQIIVEPGAKLLVTGYQGLYSANAACLVLKADADGQAAFVFHPEVGSNKSPYATVEYFAKNASSIGTDAGDKNFEIIVSPFIKIDEISNNISTEKNLPEYGSTMGSWYQTWMGTAWEQHNTAWLKANVKAFQPIAITNTSKFVKDNYDNQVTYTFKGQLQGNISGEFNLGTGYMYLGNGFVAPMDGDKILSQLSSSNIEHNIWVWSKNQFVPITEDNIATQLPSMGGMSFFILKTNQGMNLNLDYKKLIWDFNN